MRYADHKTYQEIAEELDYSITTIQRTAKRYESLLMEKSNDIN